MSIAPIVHVVDVEAPPTDVFTAFVHELGAWWDPRYSADPTTFEDAAIEPKVGGRVLATHSDGLEHEWGRVDTWDPPRRLGWSFTLAQDPSHPSLVEVEVIPRDGGSRLRLTHGGWTADNASYRSKYGDWPVLLERFTDHVARRLGPPADLQRELPTG